ncbi:tRNA (N6-threonylcarbamoyladenosine(37)-N6)-methyltransferase TrmO [Marinifilum caeruleilacunae]|uniref:tRNA (N6-threonylcarbamoyladenosine(37)-N6)-methyltransferase TrmO n=1 Tax=Marinifilum caeruleilacunae TaxID=2499076 RepID=A0ABX1WTB5_9BACT|nr:tRNA (N6-threonylcarbamoyladenosine(37)-N6)-methyltransferase TrmO [Marinifilum caeruleilacunae]NOU59353.1 tRNA (N6-threonylcarbamoyladenosine(37)-N6)-methyltransferase TrmO [Marinifilum caeruleilacunae]
MTEICFQSIGTIHTPHKTQDKMPIQPLSAKGVKAKVELKPEFAAGLRDLESFSHVILIFHLHKSDGFDLDVLPFMDDQTHGVFATRAPRRPNAIGISTVKLHSIEGNILHVEDVDILDGTPLLDIKPFFSKFDNRPDAVSGWLDEKWKEKNRDIKSDERFIK